MKNVNNNQRFLSKIQTAKTFQFTRIKRVIWQPDVFHKFHVVKPDRTLVAQASHSIQYTLISNKLMLLIFYYWSIKLHVRGFSWSRNRSISSIFVLFVKSFVQLVISAEHFCTLGVRFQCSFAIAMLFCLIFGIFSLTKTRGDSRIELNLT